MEPSVKCINLIKSFEGLSLIPYKDVKGVVTIGYGSTRYPDGRHISMQDHKITESEAFSYLMFDVTNFSKEINDIIKTHLTQNQYDAIVSFTYNVGIGALTNSTLLKKLNKNPNDSTIEIEFLKWKKSGGKVIQGLLNRRIKESQLYFSK